MDLLGILGLADDISGRVRNGFQQIRVQFQLEGDDRRSSRGRRAVPAALGRLRHPHQRGAGVDRRRRRLTAPRRAGSPVMRTDTLVIGPARPVWPSAATSPPPATTTSWSNATRSATAGGAEHVGLPPAPHAELDERPARRPPDRSRSRRVRDRAALRRPPRRVRRAFGAPVVTGTAVDAVRRRGERFEVSTSGGTWSAGNVVVATGWCDRPAVPALAALGCGRAQLTADRLPAPRRPRAGRRAGRRRVGHRRAAGRTSCASPGGTSSSPSATTPACRAPTAAWTSSGGCSASARSTAPSTPCPTPTRPGASRRCNSSAGDDRRPSTSRALHDAGVRLAGRARRRRGRQRSASTTASRRRIADAEQRMAALLARIDAAHRGQRPRGRGAAGRRAAPPPHARGRRRPRPAAPPASRPCCGPPATGASTRGCTCRCSTAHGEIRQPRRHARARPVRARAALPAPPVVELHRRRRGRRRVRRRRHRAAPAAAPSRSPAMSPVENTAADRWRPARAHYDAVVVGARAAGAATAMLLARRRARRARRRSRPVRRRHPVDPRADARPAWCSSPAGGCSTPSSPPAHHRSAAPRSGTPATWYRSRSSRPTASTRCTHPAAPCSTRSSSTPPSGPVPRSASASPSPPSPGDADGRVAGHRRPRRRDPTRHQRRRGDRRRRDPLHRRRSRRRAVRTPRHRRRARSPTATGAASRPTATSGTSAPRPHRV